MKVPSGFTITTRTFDKHACAQGAAHWFPSIVEAIDFYEVIRSAFGENTEDPARVFYCPVCGVLVVCPGPAPRSAAKV